MSHKYSLRMLAGIRDLYRDKLLSLGIRSFAIKNSPDRNGVIITLAKPFPRGTRWELVYGVPADVRVKPPGKK